MAAANQPATEPILPAAAPVAVPGASNGAAGQREKDSGTKPAVANNGQGPAPALMSQEEYDQKNNRRCDLIFKATREGLTAEEQNELAQLQIAIRAWNDAHFPLPPVNTEFLEELARSLGTSLELPERD